MDFKNYKPQIQITYKNNTSNYQIDLERPKNPQICQQKKATKS